MEYTYEYFAKIKQEYRFWVEFCNRHNSQECRQQRDGLRNYIQILSRVLPLIKKSREAK